MGENHQPRAQAKTQTGALIRKIKRHWLPNRFEVQQPASHVAKHHDAAVVVRRNTELGHDRIGEKLSTGGGVPRDQRTELFEPIADIGSAPFDYSVSNEVADLRHRESTRARGGPPSPQAQPSPRARATHVESSTGRGHGPRQRGVKQLGDRDGPRSGTALRSVTPSRVLSQTR